MTEERQEMGSLLGQGSEFEGKLTFFGIVRIEGTFTGEIRSADTLVVAAGGEVRGKIDVGSLIVTGGLVEAEVTAHQVVELHPAGRLVGEVRTPSFQIEKGAVFQGQSLMPEDEPDPEDDELPELDLDPD